jgi:lipoprotein-anchoring transpeptidase ErfK/SrfK
MARIYRHTLSRAVVSVTVIAVTIGAVVQFHRLKKSAAVTPPPLQMSLAGQGALQPAHPSVPKTSVASSAPTAPAVAPALPSAPLITQTPDVRKPGQPMAQLVQNWNSQQPSPVKLVSSQQTPPVQVTPLQATPPAQPSAPLSIVDANAKVTAGDLLGARTELNSLLLAGTLSASDTEAVKKQLAELNQTIIFSTRPFPRDPLGGVYPVEPGDRLSAIGKAHQVPFELLLSLNHMTDPRKLRYGQVLKIINGPFHAVITKSKFTLDLYLGAPGGAGSTYITTFPVGLGTDNSTPTGTWKIKDKVLHPAYFPPAGHPGPTLLPDDPKNPLGPCWMGLEGTDGQAVGQQSYGIHGTIDPDSIGKQSSMGCIRLKNEDVDVVYKLLMQGKSVVVVKD